jgi:hypothetical protein
VSLVASSIFVYKLSPRGWTGKIGEILLKIIEVVVSLIIAILFKADSNTPEGTEWVLGTVIFLIFQMLELMYRSKEQHEEHQDKLNEMAKSLKDGIESQTLTFIALPYVGQDLTQDQIDQAWRELSWYVREKYEATNYQTAFYQPGHVGSILKLQAAKIDCSADQFKIRKIFIWENEDEKSSSAAEEVRKKHKTLPAEKMLFKELQHDKLKSGKIKALAALNKKTGFENSIDFAIFDGRVVVVWDLKKNERNHQGGKVFVSPDIIEDFTNFFNGLWADVPLDIS